jgi:hypothetical protein
LPYIDSVKGLAQEQGFYKIAGFESLDIEYIKSVSKLSPPELQSIHMGFLDDFIRRMYISSVEDHSRSLKGASLACY